MKSLLVLALALIVETSCGNRIAPPTKDNSPTRGTGVPLTIAASEVARTDASGEVKQRKEPPPSFRGVDFKNLSYPISWKNERVSLQDGKREYYEHKNLGNGWFHLDSVHYVDITGDAKEEAVIVLHAVLCGGSCDGGSHLFYFYSMEKRKLKLRWRFETGSLGYGCGLKSFDLKERKVILEVFNQCSFNGATLESRGDLEITRKFYAELVTRFIFEFKGSKPVLKKREILPTPQEELKSYPAKISITSD